MHILDYFILDIPGYKEFAKNEWVELHGGPKLIDMKIKKELEGIWGAFVRQVWWDRNMFGFIYILGELYNQGMKMLKLRWEELLVLGEIEVRVGIEDYHQCYETMGVEIPEEWREHLRKKYPGCRVPKVGIIHHKREGEVGEEGYQNYIIISFYVGNEYPILTTFVTETCNNFENLISKAQEEEVAQGDIDFLMVQDLIRAVLNANILIMMHGKEDLGYENVKRVRALKREGKDRDKREVYYIGMNQKIQLWKKTVMRVGEGKGEERSSPRAHWRRGYLRRQHYGSGNLGVKIVFIRPCFVCGEDYKGDMSDTSVTLEG